MTKFGKSLVALFVIIFLAGIVFLLQRKPDIQEDVVINIEMKDEHPSLDIIDKTKDLVFFSIKPGTEVSGIMTYTGSVKNGYFFEGNILINVLDIEKNILKESYANAIGDWMTLEPVKFEGSIDFSGLPIGPAYIEIRNDNASGIPENDKRILIPIIVS